jgi:hypothetical protein
MTPLRSKLASSLNMKVVALCAFQLIFVRLNLILVAQIMIRGVKMCQIVVLSGSSLTSTTWVHSPNTCHTHWINDLSWDICDRSSTHMEDPTERLILLSYYIYMHTLTLREHTFHPNLAFSLTSCKYWLERFRVLTFFQIPFSPSVLRDLNHQSSNTDLTILHLIEDIPFLSTLNSILIQISNKFITSTTFLMLTIFFYKDSLLRDVWSNK